MLLTLQWQDSAKRCRTAEPGKTILPKKHTPHCPSQINECIRAHTTDRALSASRPPVHTTVYVQPVYPEKFDSRDTRRVNHAEAIAPRQTIVCICILSRRCVRGYKNIPFKNLTLERGPDTAYSCGFGHTRSADTNKQYGVHIDEGMAIQ